LLVLDPSPLPLNHVHVAEIEYGAEDAKARSEYTTAEEAWERPRYEFVLKRRIRHRLDA
jgi:hypothetical protein